MAAVVNAKSEGHLTEELAGMFLLLVSKYALKSNFVGYTFNEDLQGDALLTLVRHWHKFDETKYKNAFSYYTQVVHNAFLQYLNKERYARNVRDALLCREGLEPSDAFMERYRAEQKSATDK